MSKVISISNHKGGGIYKIQSIIKPERYYIGSAINIGSRLKTHFKALRNNLHHSDKLQNHYNKYGAEDLQLFILLECNKEELLKEEQYFIDSLTPYFNICRVAGSPLGVIRSEETKKKLSESLKGRTSGFKGKQHSEDVKQRLRDVNTGKKLSKEAKEKLSKWSKGKLKPDEVKNRMSEAKKLQTYETKLKISEAKKGKPLTKEHRQKLSESLKGRTSPNKGRKLTEEHKEKISISKKLSYVKSRVISISNHKGGVGKTTSAINIGAGLNRLGKKILLIDLDPQANLSQSLGLIDQERNIYGALRGEYKLQPIEILKGLDIIPSTLDLSGAEVEMSGEAGREYILRELIEPIRASYDYILIDSPPSLGLLTINSFTASDEVFIPLQAQYLALQGLTKLLEVIDKIKKRLNKELRVGGVFITQYDSRKVLNRDVVATIEAHFKDEVFKTRVRDNIALAEAPAQGVDIFRYNPKSYGAEDYLSLSKEILKRK